MDTTDPKPLTCSKDVARLPTGLTELCAMPNWVVWRWTKNGSGKWTKPPFQSQFPHTLARNNEATTWSSHAAAAEAVTHGKADGVGFVLTETNVVAIDLDRCHDPATGKIDSWAQAIIDQADGAYVEITVSGTGLRVVGKGAGEKAHTNYKVEGRDGAKIEIYRGAVRYITVSGVEIGHCAALSNIDALIDNLVAQYGEKQAAVGDQGNFKLARRGINDLIRNGAPERQRSEVFQSVIFRLANAGLSIDDIEQALTEYPNGIAQKYADRLRDEIERSYCKWKNSVGNASDGPDTRHGDRSSVHGNAYNWDDPDWSILEDRRGELPDFPLDALPEKCRDWVERAAHGAGATAAHVAVPMLGILSSLIGTVRRVRASRSWTEPMTCWAAVVGFSGTSKTPGINATKRALSQVERDRKPKIAEQQRAHESRVEAAKAARAVWKKEVEKLAEQRLYR
jgi:hypothetical protein